MIRTGRWSLLAVACGAWACSSDGDGSGSAGSFYTEYANLLCDTLSNCCAETGNPVEASDCKTLVGYQQQGFEHAVSSGTVEFDQAKADACLSKLRAGGGSCAIKPVPECEEVAAGTLGPGESCENDGECAKPAGGDAECEMDFDSESDTGKCVQEARGKAGDACQQTCTEHEDGGSVCSGFGDPAEGAMRISCWRGDGLACEGDQDARKCVALAAAGEACSGNDACEDGLYCPFSEHACKAPAADGEACSENDGCVEGYCGADDKCASPKAVGEACDASAGRDPCGPGGTCDSDSDKCVAGLFGGDPLTVACGFFGGFSEE